MIGGETVIIHIDWQRSSSQYKYFPHHKDIPTIVKSLL